MEATPFQLLQPNGTARDLVGIRRETRNLTYEHQSATQDRLSEPQRE
jgi:hypothetical protein